MDLSVSWPISDEEGRSKSEGSRESGVRASKGVQEPEGTGEPEDVRASEGAGTSEESPATAGRDADRVMDRILRSRGAAAPGAS